MKVINADDEADDAAIEYLGVETGVQMWHKAPRSCNHTLQTGLKVTIEKNEADILNVAVVEQSIQIRGVWSPGLNWCQVPESAQGRDASCIISPDVMFDFKPVVHKGR